MNKYYGEPILIFNNLEIYLKEDKIIYNNSDQTIHTYELKDFKFYKNFSSIHEKVYNMLKTKGIEV